jgi:hypothetical protein
MREINTTIETINSPVIAGVSLATISAGLLGLLGLAGCQNRSTTAKQGCPVFTSFDQVHRDGNGQPPPSSTRNRQDTIC